MTTTAWDDIEAAGGAAVAELRKDCRCADYRKPCEYCAGMDEGALLAMTTIYQCPRADVGTWLDGG